MKGFFKKKMVYLLDGQNPENINFSDFEEVHLQSSKHLYCIPSFIDTICLLNDNSPVVFPSWFKNIGVFSFETILNPEIVESLYVQNYKNESLKKCCNMRNFFSVKLNITKDFINNLPKTVHSINTLVSTVNYSILPEHIKNVNFGMSTFFTNDLDFSFLTTLKIRNPINSVLQEIAKCPILEHLDAGTVEKIPASVKKLHLYGINERIVIPYNVETLYLQGCHASSINFLPINLKKLYIIGGKDNAFWNLENLPNIKKFKAKFIDCDVNLIPQSAEVISLYHVNSPPIKIWPKNIKKLTLQVSPKMVKTLPKKLDKLKSNSLDV